jgi:hypothetical protein
MIFDQITDLLCSWCGITVCVVKCGTLMCAPCGVNLSCTTLLLCRGRVSFSPLYSPERIVLKFPCTITSSVVSQCCCVACKLGSRCCGRFHIDWRPHMHSTVFVNAKVVLGMCAAFVRRLHLRGPVLLFGFPLLCDCIACTTVWCGIHIISTTGYWVLTASALHR